jgi:hypothetical protein
MSLDQKVTRGNVATILPSVLAAIESASFVAIDMEFSGFDSEHVRIRYARATTATQNCGNDWV